jgi:hypothetical protein
MPVLKFTGTAGPDMREGQGIIALFAHPVAASSPRLKPLRPLIPQSYNQRLRSFFVRHGTPYPFLLMIIDLIIAGVISET